jgi:uncharacterized protein
VLTVDHVVQPSPIHGLGVFTREAARKGQVLWRFNPLIDREIAFADLLNLPLHAITQVLRHSEFVESRNTFILASDGDYYMNHADDPTLIDDGNVMYAAQNLEVGAELTCDYRIVRVLGFHPDGTRADPIQAITLSALRQRNLVELSIVLEKYSKERVVACA